MRIWILISIAIVAGLSIGLAATVVELGPRPEGGDRVIYGGKGDAPAPPTVNPPGVYPKAVLENGEHDFDFGSAERDESQQHDFVVRNEGQGILTLTAGQSSCVCTVAKIEKEQLKPGQRAKITLQWHGKSLGPFRQNATIVTNDPDHSTLDLVVAGEIVSAYKIEPDRLTFGGFSAGETAKASARIVSFATDDLAVVEHSLVEPNSAKYFDLKTEKMTRGELEKFAGAKSGVTLTVAIKPGLPAGPFQQTIGIQLNLPDHPKIDLPLDGKVNGPIEVVGVNWNAEGGILMLGQIQSREGAKAKLFLMVRGTPAADVRLKIDSIKPDDLQATLGAAEKLSPTVARVPLAIEIPPGSRPVAHLGNQQGHLVQLFIDTGLAEPKQLRILIRYAVE